METSYTIQRAEYEQSNFTVANNTVNSDLDINFDKDIGEVKFTIESVLAVTESFMPEIDKLLSQSVE